MSSSSETNEKEEVSASTLLTTIMLYGIIMLIGWIYFELIRDKYRLVYATRDRSEETRNRICEKKYNFFGWIRPVLMFLTDDDLIDFCGLDIVMFLRFQRIGITIALVGMITSIVLFPVYGTGHFEEGSSYEQNDSLAYLTMGNVKNGSSRLYASILAAYSMTITALYLILKEYQFFINRRHEFLRKQDLHQHSVLVQNLPIHLRSSLKLEKFMNELFPKQVRKAAVPIDLGDLPKRILLQENARRNLEHALVLKSKYGNTPVHKVKKRGCFGGIEVDSIATYESELAELNVEIVQKITSLLPKYKPMDTQIQKEYHRSILQESQNVSIAQDNELEVDPHFGVTDVPEYPDEQEITHLNNTSACNSSHILEASSFTTGFVSFKSIHTAQMAQQLLLSKTPHEMNVVAAPAVDDVSWESVKLTQLSKALHQIISSVITWLIIVFWTVPTSFVVALSSVEGLKASIPGFSDFLSENAWFENVLQQLGPLLLVIMGAIVPSIFRALSQREGHEAVSQCQASMFIKLVYFQLVQQFFVAAISGSILSQLKNIIDDPQSIVTILGTSIPGQSTFFMSVIFIQTGLGLTLELVQLGPRIMAFIHQKIAPTLTERERNSTWKGISPIVCNHPFNYYQPIFLAQGIFVFVLVIVYAPISPLLTYFGMFYFLIGDMIYRRQVLFVYDPACSTAGVFWHHISQAIIIALVLAQLSMVGILGIKESGAAVFLFVLPIVTLIFNRYICNVLLPLSQNLPLIEITKSSSVHEYFQLEDHDDSPYIQPPLKQKPLKPECTEY